MRLAICWLTLLSCGEPTSAGGSGELLWEVDGLMSTAPAVVGDVVVTAMVSGQLVGRDLRTGRSLWQRTFSGTAFNSQRLLSVGDVVITPHFQLHGVDARTGSILWTFAGREGTAGVLAPTVSGDTVFVAGFVGGTAAALNARTGQVYWSRDFPQLVYHPSVGDDVVIYPLRHASVPNPELPNELVALDRYTGEIRWRRELPPGPPGFINSTDSGGAIIGDRTVVALRPGEVRAIRLSDGELLWSRSSNNPSRQFYWSHPIAVGDAAVTMRTGDGRLEGWSAADGTLRWFADLTDGVGSLFDSPRACGSRLCFASGRVWILDTNGNELWSDGGGSGAIFLSNVTASEDGILIAGVNYNASNRARIRAFRPPVAVGATR